MIDHSAGFDLRPAVEPCIQRRLDEVQREPDRARVAGRLRDIGEIGVTGVRSFRTGTWASAVGNGDTLYLDPAIVSVLTDDHEMLRDDRSVMNEARLSRARLSVLTHAPGRIDDNSLSSARQTLAELRMLTARGRPGAGLLQGHRFPVLPVKYLPFGGQSRTRAQAIRAASPCRPPVTDGSVGGERG